MAGYQSKLLNRFEVAQDTMAFHFEKPPGFDFKPGQFTDVILMNPRETDARGKRAHVFYCQCSI
jgi:ferredoxin-NADP reductase